MRDRAMGVLFIVSGLCFVAGVALGAGHWAGGLGTAFFALPAPAALACFGLSIARTRRFPRWSGVVLLIAAAALSGQFAVFRGALPFPQFLAFIALGITALKRPHPPASPASLAPGFSSPQLAARD